MIHRYSCIRHATALVLSALALALAMPALAQTVINAHVTSSGVQATSSVDQNGSPALSDGGTWVVFSTTAALVTGDVNGRIDVYAHDNFTGQTVLISGSSSGSLANEHCFRPWISSSGRYVVYQSSASNLVPGDTNGLPDVFRCDRDADGNGTFDEPGTKVVARVSVGPAGEQGNGPSRCYVQSISDDGNRIAFESEATNFFPGDANGGEDCFVRDVTAGTTTHVSVNSAGVPATVFCQGPAISGNGQAVAFFTSSGTCNLVPGDTNEASDIFVRDLVGGTTERVSVATGGAQATGWSILASLSDDGNLVAFESNAPDLVGGDTNGASDIFVHNRTANTTIRVSVNGAGSQTGGGTAAVISGDGTMVTYSSLANDIVGGDTNGVSDVFVHALAGGATARASRSAAGVQGDATSVCAAPSQDGTMVAFLSDATNLLGPGGDTNGVMDAFVRTSPLSPAEALPAPPDPTAGPDNYPVTFSVNGPVDPQTEGIRDARGAAPSPQVPLQPGNPTGFGIRIPPVPQAAGLPTVRPGDVFDYAAAALPSEAVIFQSMPPVLPLFPEGAAPDFTDNQIVESVAAGLMSGPGLGSPFWTEIPPAAPPRDNVDALSFGEDYFPAGIVVGLDPFSPLPAPLAPAAVPWSARLPVPGYSEPVVLSDAPGISFRFSVDPWAVGLPGTAVAVQSGGVDAGAGLGPWVSPGAAAGDVFATPMLMRLGGATVGAGGNLLVFDNPALALAPLPPPLPPMEDDLDALECVGTNTNWMTGAPMLPGNVHGRVMEVGVDLPPPGVSAHDANNATPVFFSVTRNSIGAAGSAVRSQFVNDGGAAADIFVMVKDPAMPPGTGTNLLFMDESELGLYALDSSPVGTSPLDYTDDLDALILRVCPEFRATVVSLINFLIGTGGGSIPWTLDPVTGARTGGGMTVSMMHFLKDLVPPDCVEVGFSVSTDAIGLEYTAVDWEAGPVAPPVGTTAACGDIFYAAPLGAPVNPNFLWYEETDLGLAPGAWVNGVSVDLAALSDNLDALDSSDSTYEVAAVPPGRSPGSRTLGLAPAVPNPFRDRGTVLSYALPRDGRARLSIHDIAGRTVAVLVDGWQGAGEHAVRWDARPAGGAAVRPGVYFAKLEFAGTVRTGKLVRVE